MIDALEDDEVDIDPRNVVEGQVAVQKVRLYRLDTSGRLIH